MDRSTNGNQYEERGMVKCKGKAEMKSPIFTK